MEIEVFTNRFQSYFYNKLETRHRTAAMSDITLQVFKVVGLPQLYYACTYYTYKTSSEVTLFFSW